MMASSASSVGCLQARWPIQTFLVPIHVNVPALPGSVCAHLLQTMVKFVLFIREQISAPYHEISALVDSEQLRRSSGKPCCRSSAMNRYIKFVSEAEAVLSAISNVCARFRIHRVYLVLGSALTSAREIFDVTFSDQNGLTADYGIETGNEQQIMDAISRSMLRQLISTYSEVLPTNTQRSTLFLLVQCDRGPDCPDGFVPKHNLAIRPRKDAVQLRVCVRNHTDLVNDEDDAGDRLWFQSCTSIKGLRGVPLPNT